MTDEEILRAIASGGRLRDDAVVVLYRRHAQPMLRFFVHQGAPADDACDILQDTVLKVVRGAAGFDGRGEARAWLWQVARNCLLDSLGRQGRTAAFELTLDPAQWEQLAEAVPVTGAARSAGPEAQQVDQAMVECVSAGLESFGREMPERAQVLTLQMQGLSVQAIAQRIGRSAGATREYLSQCRRKIEPFIAHCRAFLEGGP